MLYAAHTVQPCRSFPHFHIWRQTGNEVPTLTPPVTAYYSPIPNNTIRYATLQNGRRRKMSFHGALCSLWWYAFGVWLPYYTTAPNVKCNWHREGSVIVNLLNRIWQINISNRMEIGYIRSFLLYLFFVFANIVDTNRILYAPFKLLWPFLFHCCDDSWSYKS